MKVMEQPNRRRRGWIIHRKITWVEKRGWFHLRGLPFCWGLCSEWYFDVEGCRVGRDAEWMMGLRQRDCGIVPMEE